MANTRCAYDAKTGKVVSEPGPLQQLMEEDGWVGGKGVVTTDEKGRHIVDLVAAHSS